MSKINLVVFDFDGTLYKGNSFHDFMIYFFKVTLVKFHWLLTIKIVWAVLLRVLGVFNHEGMKKKIVFYAMGFLDRNQIQDFVFHLFDGLNQTVYEKLTEIQNNQEVILISSAAPCIYMNALAKNFNVANVHCSGFKESLWIENIRDHKLLLLEEDFEGYHFMTLYTDHYDDISLSQSFQQVFLVNPSQVTTEKYLEAGVEFELLN